MIKRLIVAAALLVQIEDEARAAFPRECCGLLVGQRHDNDAEVFLAHPASNLAEHDDGFEIDPQTQFALLRALQGTGRETVGCYHSHPNGRAQPSPQDTAGASEANFIWLIAGVEPDGGCTLRAFVFDGRAFQVVQICETLAA